MKREMESMELKEELARLKAIYDKIPPMSCLNWQKCCVCGLVCSAIEYQYIKIYVKENFTLEQRGLFEKRIMTNRFIETMFKHKKGIVRSMPCIFIDKNNKKCLIYPGRTFLCRIGGLKGLRGICGNVKISDGRDFDIKNVKELSRCIKDISKSFISEYGVFKRDYDFLRNWLYVERFGTGSRMPLGDDKQMFDVEDVLDGRRRLGDGRGVHDVDFDQFFVL